MIYLVQTVITSIIFLLSALLIIYTDHAKSAQRGAVLNIIIEQQPRLVNSPNLVQKKYLIFEVD